MVERELPKLEVGVRFSVPAPSFKTSELRQTGFPLESREAKEEITPADWHLPETRFLAAMTTNSDEITDSDLNEFLGDLLHEPSQSGIPLDSDHEHE